jgi:iron complex transport system substrate-binding protein
MTLNSPSEARPAPARTIAPAVFAVALLVVAGAAVAVTATYFELRPSTPHSSGPTVTVVDDLGRRVTAPVNASRIVVLAPSIMDIVSRLGLESRVVGIGCIPNATGILDEYSPNQTSAWDLTPAMCIQDYPGLDKEGLLNRSPQIVLASTITSAADVETISVTFGIPVVILAPSGIEGIIGDVALVGQLFPADAATVPLESELQLVLANASALDTNLSTNNVTIPSVLLAYYFDDGGYYTYGPGTFGESMIELAGGSDIAAGVPLTYFEMNGSSVLDDQPNVIVYGTSWNDPALVSGETPSTWSSSGGAPYWSQLNGTKDAVDVTVITEADPTMILALPLLEHWFHPSLVPAP